MVKNRLIFTFLLNNGVFILSRNFRHQKVGDLEWVKKYYNFEKIAFSIDELIVLNVDTGFKDVVKFSKELIRLSKFCLMPIAAGGGIRTVEDASILLNSGADKLVINTALITNPDLVRKLVQLFGSQCIVASIDYKKNNISEEVMIENGTKNTGLTVEEAVIAAQELGVGELYITSINLDGTGQGLDLDLIKRINNISKVPVIASGGVGQYSHFYDGMYECSVKAISTANIFNFLGNGLLEARNFLIEKKIDLAVWA